VCFAFILHAGETLYKMSDCFGKTTYQHLDPDKIIKIEPANCTDKEGRRVFRILLKEGGLRPYLMNEIEIDVLLNTPEILKRDMKAQEIQELREGLLLDATP
jgi:hypothetical protein